MLVVSLLYFFFFQSIKQNFYRSPLADNRPELAARKIRKVQWIMIVNISEPL